MDSCSSRTETLMSTPKLVERFIDILRHHRQCCHQASAMLTEGTKRIIRPALVGLSKSHLCRACFVNIPHLVEDSRCSMRCPIPVFWVIASVNRHKVYCEEDIHGRAVLVERCSCQRSPLHMIRCVETVFFSLFTQPSQNTPQTYLSRFLAALSEHAGAQPQFFETTLNAFGATTLPACSRSCCTVRTSEEILCLASISIRQWSRMPRRSNRLHMPRLNSIRRARSIDPDICK